MKSRLAMVSCVLVVTATTCAASLPHADGTRYGMVARVIDGDTVVFVDRETFRKTTIRIAGIDAPEIVRLRKDGQCLAWQPWGCEAAAVTLELCDRKDARIEPLNRDRYGRTVARLRCGAPAFDVAESLVRAGLAWVWPGDKVRPPLLDELQRDARAKGVGLWHERHPVPPWVWRKAQP